MSNITAMKKFWNKEVPKSLTTIPGESRGKSSIQTISDSSYGRWWSLLLQRIPSCLKLKVDKDSPAAANRNATGNTNCSALFADRPSLHGCDTRIGKRQILEISIA